MPIDDMDLRGTEKDGSKSHEYCSFCYDKGAFIAPHITLGDMKVIMQAEMSKRKIPQAVIDMALTTLPFLKRWKHKTGIL
jgi:hypothetical protein